MTLQFRGQRLRSGILLACIFLSIELPRVLAEQSVVQKELSSQGREKLADKDYDRALELFNQALQQTQDPKEKAGLQFYAGVAYQRRSAMPGRAAADKRQDLQRAVESYQEALSSAGPQGPAFNNLAQVYKELGLNKLAEQAFRDAIQVGDNRQAFYLLNYAEYLSSIHGDWKEATNKYHLALGLEPGLERAHERLVEAYLSLKQPGNVVAYLWETASRGQVTRAMTTALRLLEERHGDIESISDGLLAVAVFSLSKQTYARDEFAKSDRFVLWRQLTNSASLRQAAREVEQLHAGQLLLASDYPFWGQPRWRDEDAPQGLWPEEAFLKLVGEFGRREQKAGKNDKAEAYFQLAVRLRADRPDPDAFVNAVDFFTTTNQREKITALIREFEDRLLMQKDQEYRRSRMRKVYKLHRALGLIYASTGAWESAGRITSARFQLESAVRAVEHYNAEAEKRRFPELLPLDPRVVNLLVEYYKKEEHVDEDVRLRVRAAKQYLLQDNVQAAREIVAPVQPEMVPVAERLKFDQIHGEIQRKGRFGTHLVLGVPEWSRLLSQPLDDREGKLTFLSSWKKDAPTVSRGELEKIGVCVKTLLERPAATNDVLHFFPIGVNPGALIEVRLNAFRGTAITERDSKRVEIPFVVETEDPRIPKNLHYAKP